MSDWSSWGSVVQFGPITTASLRTGVDGPFRGRRDSLWRGEGGFTLAVWQERRLFGHEIEARVSGGTPAHTEAVRAILADVGVELHAPSFQAGATSRPTK